MNRSYESQDEEDIIEKEMRKFGSYVKITNYVLATLTFVYIFFFLLFSGKACATNDLAYLGPINQVISIMFCLLAIIFLIVGTVMNLSLRKHFPEFY